MSDNLLVERDVRFLLYEMFDLDETLRREAYQDHDRETCEAVMVLAQKMAKEAFLPLRSLADTQQPRFEQGRAEVLSQIGDAVSLYAQAGLLRATHRADQGGMQLPEMVAALMNGYLAAANIGVFGYAYLTQAAADLIAKFGTSAQRQSWLEPMLSGRYWGTMALTESDAGSGLADLRTSAHLHEDGTYRLNGSKIFISGGDHELSENIVHLVLARIKGAPAGTKGISLFICPKYLLDDDGNPSQRNDVQLTGLFHKMGGRAHTSTQLTFGEQDRCVGYLMGQGNDGLKLMFSLMNDARVAVGSSAAVLAYTGYRYSLGYAKQRLQGRSPTNKDPLSPPLPIIEHADVKRMLLAQKAYAELSLALCIYGRKLIDDQKTHSLMEQREKAGKLLDLLTPVIKSWPSKWGLQANYYAIQVLGGHGYTNEHPVEQLYRDNRLNPIHEGTSGIQALDLLGRKVLMGNGEHVGLLVAEMQRWVAKVSSNTVLQPLSQQLQMALSNVQEATQSVVEQLQAGQTELALANVSKYLDAFGHLVVAWLALWQGHIALRALEQGSLAIDDVNFYRGKVAMMHYFYTFEVPHIATWCQMVQSMPALTIMTCNDYL